MDDDLSANNNLTIESDADDEGEGEGEETTPKNIGESGGMVIEEGEERGGRGDNTKDYWREWRDGD